MPCEPEIAEQRRDLIIVSVTDQAWYDSGIDFEQITDKCVRACERTLGEPLMGELSVNLMGDDQIRQLNRDFREKDKPTNVLSFPADGINPAIGDIAIARETLIREANEKNISLSDHLCHIFIHAYLHLSGYDHTLDRDADIMEALEIEILDSLGIKNPYIITPNAKSQHA